MTQFRPSRKLWQKIIYICIYRFFVGHFDIYIYFFRGGAPWREMWTFASPGCEIYLKIKASIPMREKPDLIAPWPTLILIYIHYPRREKILRRLVEGDAAITGGWRRARGVQAPRVRPLPAAVRARGAAPSGRRVERARRAGRLAGFINF